MKIYVSTLILTTFALRVFSKAIKPSIKFPLPEGNQNILSNDVDRSVPGKNQFSYCQDDYQQDILQLEYVNLNPEVPEKGKTLIIEAGGQLLQETKEGAFARVKVAYGLITLINMEVNLCDQISNVNLTCPLEQGRISITKEVRLPDTIPPGTYKVSADAYTVDDKRLVCLTSEIRFRP